MLKKCFFVLFLLIILTISSNQSNAALITSDVGYTGPFIDLSAYSNNEYYYTTGETGLPGGMSFAANPTGNGNWGGSILGNGFYDLWDNGVIEGLSAYAALDSYAGYMRFSLAAPVSSFGVYLNYSHGWEVWDEDGNVIATYDDSQFAPIISVLDATGNVLETYNLAQSGSISTPGGVNEFAFRGIAMDSAVIYSLQLENSYILVKGAQSGTPPADVPEASVVILFILGLVSLVISWMVARKSVKNIYYR